MAGLADMTWGACVVPGTTLPATLTAEVRRGMGAVPGRLGRLAPVPWRAGVATEPKRTRRCVLLDAC